MSERIVIVGGGFAGASVARRLEKRVPDADIRLVSPDDYMLYLPLLPQVAAGFLPAAAAVADDVAPIGYGLTDLPAQQARARLAVDLVHGEHVLIAGGPRSGRSTALRTISGALARDTSPTDVHLYAIDCGANALLPLDGGHIAGALYEGLKRSLAKLFRRPDPGYVDTAKMLPIAYAVGGLILLSGVVLILADLIDPIKLF